jgi:hypothetical protein
MDTEKWDGEQWSEGKENDSEIVQFKVEGKRLYYRSRLVDKLQIAFLANYFELTDKWSNWKFLCPLG